jgi:alpha-galactosidase
MCHEMPNGIYRLSKFLRVDHHDIEATAAGINHFTFFSELRNRRTGEDLLPKVKELFARKIFDYGPKSIAATRWAQRFAPLAALADELYMPLVAHVVREYGMVPCSIDSHIGEYLPFTADVADWYPARVDVMENFSNFTERLSSWVARTSVPVPLQRIGHSPEEVVPIIAALWSGESQRIMAMNVPNAGNVPNLAEGAIVEVGGTVDAHGLHPDHCAPIDEQLAEWTRPQIALQDLIVESALTGDADLAFQALVEDPLSPPSESACRAMFDELRQLQAAHLPF